MNEVVPPERARRVGLSTTSVDLWRGRLIVFVCLSWLGWIAATHSRPVVIVTAATMGLLVGVAGALTVRGFWKLMALVAVWVVGTWTIGARFGSAGLGWWLGFVAGYLLPGAARLRAPRL